MAAKVKALQMWCKKQCDGYRDVQVTNMTSSFKSGLAFCAIIHRFRPDLIDYDSLSKENVFDNNKLAFDVASNELDIAALLDAEDMVAMKVPDKLCIVTYVAQYANYFRDKPPVGGPGVKGKVGVKRHTPKENIDPVHEAKRPTPDTTVKQQTSKVPPSGGSVEASAKRNTFGDKCAMCGKKVYVLERHFEGTTLYHRRCIRGSQRASSFGKTGETRDDNAKEDLGKKEKENQVPTNGPSSLLNQLNSGPKPYAPSKDDVRKTSDTTGTTGMSSLLSRLRGGPAPYKGEAATTPQKARQVDMKKTDWNKFLGVAPTATGGLSKGVEKMDVDDDVPPPLPLSKVPPKKPPRLCELTGMSTVTEKTQPVRVEQFKRITEEQPNTVKKNTKTCLRETPENKTVLSGLMHSLATVRHGGAAGTSGAASGGQAAPVLFTVIKTTSPESKSNAEMISDSSNKMSTQLGQRTTPFESVQQSDKSKGGHANGVTTKKMDSSQELKAKIRTFEDVKEGSGSKGKNVTSFCSSRKTLEQKPASGVTTSLQQFPKHPQPNSHLKGTSSNNKGPTVIRPPASILKNGSNNKVTNVTTIWDCKDNSNTESMSGSESHNKTNNKTNSSDLSPIVAGNNFSAFNINDSVELDTGRNSERGERTRAERGDRCAKGETGKGSDGGEKGEKDAQGKRAVKEERAGRGKPTWQVEVEARGGKIPRQQVPRHGKKEMGGEESAEGETDWQREARRREKSRGGKYVDPEKKHVHIIKASPSSTSPVPEHVSSPNEHVSSPTERTSSPTEPVESPTERSKSPVGQVKTLTDHTGPTAEHAKSAGGRMESPTEFMGSPAVKNTHLKRGEVFYIRDKTDEHKRPEPGEKAVEGETEGKTEWQLEAVRRQRNRLNKYETATPTPAPRHVTTSPGGRTEMPRPQSVSVVVDEPACVRVKPHVIKSQWQIDTEKQKMPGNGLEPGKTVEYAEVVIENGPKLIERPYIIGDNNRVKYTEVNVSKKVIQPETRFSFNLHDFKPAADAVEPTNPVKPPPARPPIIPSRKTKRAPLPPTVIRPSQTPKRTVNAEKRMSTLEICRQLRVIDIELRDLEAEGRDLENQIRSGTDDEMDTSEDLMVQWFGLINQRNELVRKEADLMYRQKQQELEGKHEDVEYELRCLMDKPDDQKTASEKAREQVLLQELLETVNMRNSIVDSMEEDRIRYIEEDQEIAEVLGMQSLGSDTQLSSKPGIKTQKPTKNQQKNGFMKPVPAAR